MCQQLFCVSSVGRREEGKALLDRLLVPSRLDLGVGAEGMAGWEFQHPGNRPLWAPDCRLPGPAPRGTMSYLLGQGRSSGWEWGWGGWPGPLGLSLHSQPVPPAGRQRELGQLAEEAWARGTLFQFPLPPVAPVGEALGKGKAAAHCPAGTRIQGGEGTGHF